MSGLLSGSWPEPRKLLAIGLLGVTFTACSSSTGPDPSEASYSGVFDPPRLALATENCDRFLTGATLILGDDTGVQNEFAAGYFELSVDLTDDCSPGGGETSTWREVISGEYAFTDSTLVFGSPLTSFPEFSATFDEQFVRLELPPHQAWPALTSVTIELGPREPL